MRGSAQPAAAKRDLCGALLQALSQPGQVRDGWVAGHLPLMGPAVRSSDSGRAQPLHGATALTGANSPLARSHGMAPHTQLPSSYGCVAGFARFLDCSCSARRWLQGDTSFTLQDTALEA